MFSGPPSLSLCVVCWLKRKWALNNDFITCNFDVTKGKISRKKFVWKFSFDGKDWKVTSNIASSYLLKQTQTIQFSHLDSLNVCVCLATTNSISQDNSKLKKEKATR